MILSNFDLIIDEFDLKIKYNLERYYISEII